MTSRRSTENRERKTVGLTSFWKYVLACYLLDKTSVYLFFLYERELKSLCTDVINRSRDSLVRLSGPRVYDSLCVDFM